MSDKMPADKPARPLPQDLIARYKSWKQSGHAEQAAHFADLAKGQNPMAMVISCSDSRVQSTEIFAVPAGSFFVHRNIANLVPPYKTGSDYHGTASAIEYAVTALKVPHLIIMGHAQCGGVQACFDLCENNISAADSGFQFVGHWLENLRPSYAKIDAKAADRPVALGHQGIIDSLDNLMGYPFVAAAVKSGALELHGLWHDIGPGVLYGLNPTSGKFEPL